MSKTAQEVIAEEIWTESDLWDLDDDGMAAAQNIIDSLERHGYRIIRHRIVSDPE